MTTDEIHKQATVRELKDVLAHIDSAEESLELLADLMEEHEHKHADFITSERDEILTAATKLRATLARMCRPSPEDRS